MELAVQQQQPALTFTEEQVETIRRAIAKDATKDELALFLHAAKYSGLSPLSREIHFLKDKSGRVSFVADISGLQKRADSFPDYRGIRHAVVFEGDEFEVDYVNTRIVKHVNNPFAGGKPIGAWAIVERENRIPTMSIVSFHEYFKPGFGEKKSLWEKMPQVMISKVARSTALRLAFPSAFSGVYERAELPMEEAPSAQSLFKVESVVESQNVLTEEQPQNALGSGETDLMAQINEAVSIEALNKLAPAITKSPAEEQPTLKAAYANRRAFLKESSQC